MSGLDLDVLVPCCGRPASLAAVLAGLTAQSVHGSRLLLSDQSDGEAAYDDPAVRGVLRVLEHRGDVVQASRHLELPTTIDDRRVDAYAAAIGNPPED